MSDQQLLGAEAVIAGAPLKPGQAPDRIGLCFSGGGLRATFFHLGVIRALRARGLLARVKQIYSVSGGSILGAHLVLNWDKYNGSDQDYADMEQELRAFGARDLRGRVVRRWLLGCTFPFLRIMGKFGRTDLLEREYSRLYNEKSLADLGRSTKPPQPDIHILATSFTTGNLCSFSRKGFWMDDGGDPRLIPSTIIPLSLAVTASSAFPPLFPPVPITRKTLGASEAEMPLEPDYLSDGGVFDNLGFEKFSRTKFGEDDQPHWLILSDAGASFDWDVKRQFSWIVSRTIRATDILMKRLDERVLAAVTTSRSRTIHLPISKSRDKADLLPVDLQRRIAKIRTDLDVFSPIETDLLIRFGYEVCSDALDGHMPANRPGSPASWRQYDGEATKADLQRLHRADVRSIGIFNGRDWASFALIAWILILVSAAPAVLWVRSAAVEQQSAEATVLIDQARVAVSQADALARQAQAAPPGAKQDNPPNLQPTPSPTATPSSTTAPSPTPTPNPTMTPGTAPDTASKIRRSDYALFVQFAGVITRDEINGVRDKLVGLGWRVLGNLQRTPAAAGLNEIRYSGDDDQAATLLAQELGKSIQTTRPIRAERDPRVAANTLQVWISR
ncbi:patatin-like phospholipase family protein [Bradyrhizobium glycinis]|uniref:patatin-like phospholipase family protein n=1 Tax=Bradyrhizobium glycinis TaxID=2751812 RepID=UPI0018D6CFB6|nr:patatin-like phospholipase family protein [Bradyrhizobium glycinis]MBH5372853.1 patatin-like phospholipase family protein [Bradyrhizobium glycinis]